MGRWQPRRVSFSRTTVGGENGQGVGLHCAALRPWHAAVPLVREAKLRGRRHTCHAACSQGLYPTMCDIRLCPVGWHSTLKQSSADISNACSMTQSVVEEGN